MSPKIFQSVVTPAVLAYLCILALGLALFQTLVFTRTSPAFTIVADGAICTAFFFTYRRFPREAFGLLIVLFFLHEVLENHEAGFQLFGRDLIYLGCLTVGMVLYVRFFDRSKRWDRRLAPLVLGFIFFVAALAGVIALYFWWKLYRRTSVLQFLMGVYRLYLPSVFVVGVGLGIGVLLDDSGLSGRIHQAILGRRTRS